MRSDQEILEISSKQGGYMKLTKEEKEKYKAIKGDVPSEKPKSEKPNKGKKHAELNPDIQRLIQEAVQKETAHLKQENEKLRHEQKLSQDEFRELAPVEPEIKECSLRKYRRTTDDDWSLIVDMKHLRMDWNEEMRRQNKDIYKITLLPLDGGEVWYDEIPIERFKGMNDRAYFQIVDQKIVKQGKLQGKIKRTKTTKEGSDRVYWSPSYNDPNIPGRKTSDTIDMVVTRDSGTVTLKCIDPENEGFELKAFPIEKINN